MVFFLPGSNFWIFVVFFYLVQIYIHSFDVFPLLTHFSEVIGKFELSLKPIQWYQVVIIQSIQKSLKIKGSFSQGRINYIGKVPETYEEKRTANVKNGAR